MKTLLKQSDISFKDIIQSISSSNLRFNNEVCTDGCDSKLPLKKTEENLKITLRRSQQLSSQIKSFINSLKSQIECVHTLNITYSSIFNPGDIQYETSKLKRISSEGMRSFVTRLTDIEIYQKIIKPLEFISSKALKLSDLNNEVRFYYSQYISYKDMYDREFQTKICNAERLASLRNKYHENEVQYQRSMDKFSSSVISLVNELKFVERTTINLLRQYHSEFKDRTIFAIDTECLEYPGDYIPNIDISGIDADIEELLHSNVYDNNIITI